MSLRNKIFYALMLLQSTSNLIFAQSENESNQGSSLQVFSKLVTISSGYAYGVDINRDIWKVELRAAYDNFFIDELSGGPELSYVHFKGKRNGVDVNTSGITCAYILKWHFTQSEKFSLYFEHGLGGSYFVNEFPPKGTKLNGFSQVGLGVYFKTWEKGLIVFDARLMHHSNGKGIVEKNPAYDGMVFHLGYGFIF